jgi:transposase InsO family protein
VSAVGVQKPVDYLDMAVHQIVCPDVARICQSKCLQLQAMQLKNCQLWGDVSTGQFRPLVPADLRRDVFEVIHGAAHPGMRATCRLMVSKFVWPAMAKQVREWARQCVQCRRAKARPHVHVQPANFEVPARRFSHIHMDLVGPLKPADGHTHMLTIVDRATRWPEALPLRATLASACTMALFHGWVSRFGVPDVITSDRGPQFTSQVWSELCQLLNIKHNMTTAYHPESIGMVECMHRRLKDVLRARATSVSWLHDLLWVLLGIRSTPREDSGLTAAEAVFGSKVTVPGEFLSCPEKPDKFMEELKVAMSGFKPSPVRHNISSKQQLSQKQQLPQPLEEAKMVFVKNDGPKKPLAPLYRWPYLVLDRNPHYFTVQLGERVDWIAVSRLQPAFVSQETRPVQPPLHGRPRKVTFQCSERSAKASESESCGGPCRS